MNRYIEKFRQSLNNADGHLSHEKKTVRALSVINTMTLQGEYMEGNNVSDKERADVKEFMEWFLTIYGDNDAVMHAVSDNWPWGPRIFRLYDCMMYEETIDNAKKAWDGLSKAEQKKVEALTDIIWSHRVNRQISISYEDGQTWDLDIPKTLPRKELKERKDVLRLMLGDFAYCGGGMIYRREVKNDRYLVCGFWSGKVDGERKLLPYPVDALQEACETMPDGSLHVWEEDIYDVIELKDEPMFQIVNPDGQ